jgi:hypothetical protein
MRIEDKLVIELCKKNNKNRQQIELLAANDFFDVSYFLKIIKKHLVKAFVLSELIQFKIPDKVKMRVVPEAKKSVAETLLSNRIIRDEYYRAAGILNKNSIETILMKGESLNYFGLRKSRDLDILVHEDKLIESIDLLHETGYRFIGDSVNFLLNSNEKNDLSLQLKWNNQYQLFNEDIGLMIELHTNLFERDRAFNINLNALLDDIESFWENRKWDSENKVYEFSIEDKLLLMCMHTAIKRSPASNSFVLRNLMDIENLVEKKPDWDLFLKRVTKYKMCSFIYFSLLLSRRMFGTYLPPYVLDVLKENLNGRELFIEKVHLNSLQSLERNSILYSNLYRMFSPFVYHSSMKVKLKNLFLFPVLFPPKWRMANIYNIQDSSLLIFFTYLLNPFRWISIVIRNIFRK